MRNRFYNWIARNLTVESQEGVLLRTVTIRVHFKDKLIATLEYRNNLDRIKLISKKGELK
jgi:hypothetical protein